MSISYQFMTFFIIRTLVKPLRAPSAWLQEFAPSRARMNSKAFSALGIGRAQRLQPVGGVTSPSGTTEVVPCYKKVVYAS